MLAALKSVAYDVAMPARLRGRFWRALVAIAFLVATAMPAVAATHVEHAASLMSPCTEQGSAKDGMPGCPDVGGKACGLTACANLATPVPDRAAPSVVQFARKIAFPPTQGLDMVGEALRPDPLPPRTDAPA